MKYTKLTNNERNLPNLIRSVKFDAICKMGMAHIRTRFRIRLSRYYGRRLGVSGDVHLQIIPHSGIYLVHFVNLHGDCRTILEFAPSDLAAKDLDIAEVRRDPVTAVVAMLVFDRGDRIRDGINRPYDDPNVPSALRKAASPWRYAETS